MRAIAALAALQLLAAAPLMAQRVTYTGPGMERHELAPGVWAFVWDNPLGDAANVDGNAVAIINETDVVVVDAQWSPATTRRVIAEIRKLTPNPVRYVINTHWHGDHWFGNLAYQEAFPGVEFISHQHTVTDLEANEIPSLAALQDTMITGIIATLRQRLAGGVRRDGQPYTSADSAQVLRQIAAMEWVLPVAREIRPVRPTLTITDSLVLRRGERTIEIRFVGRGNTRGDLSVWLPRERVLVTGDLLVNPVPYSFGSFLGQWVQTLGILRRLPAAVVVPGHGAVQRDWQYLDLFVELLETTRAQVRRAVDQGLDLEATRRAMDLGAMRARFTQGIPARERAFDAFFIAPAVERAWREARGELGGR